MLLLCLNNLSAGYREYNFTLANEMCKILMEVVIFSEILRAENLQNLANVIDEKGRELNYNLGLTKEDEQSIEMMKGTGQEKALAILEFWMLKKFGNNKIPTLQQEESL